MFSFFKNRKLKVKTFMTAHCVVDFVNTYKVDVVQILTTGQTSYLYYRE